MELLTKKAITLALFFSSMVAIAVNIEETPTKIGGRVSVPASGAQAGKRAAELLAEWLEQVYSTISQNGNGVHDLYVNNDGCLAQGTNATVLDYLGRYFDPICHKPCNICTKPEFGNCTECSQLYPPQSSAPSPSPSPSDSTAECSSKKDPNCNKSFSSTAPVFTAFPSLKDLSCFLCFLLFGFCV